MRNKQTKIIATIAHNRCEVEFIQSLYDAGMNVARLNTAHVSIEEADMILANIRAVSDRIGVLIDTKGPEVRTCEMAEAIEVKTGDTVRIGDKTTPEGGFKVNYENFVEEIPVGSDILIDDGEIHLTVQEKDGKELVCRAENDGAIKNKKSINVPDVELDLPALTEKDAEFIDWATRSDVEFIAHSFVRSRDDVMAIQSILNMRKSPIKIIAKIENREGVDNLDSILDVAHSVMVARGDLGIEIPAEEVPIIQKQMIKTCIERVKPVITATQMLHSMIDNPRPTRAEVSDVANAIYDGTDAVMLSGETAYGKYPAEAVLTMAEIARNVEAQKGTLSHKIPVVQQAEDLMPRNHLAKSAVAMAAMLPAKAIITSTKSGDTAQICASYRGKTPIFALSASMRTVRELSLSYGVHASQIDVPHTTDELVKTCVKGLLEANHFGEDDLIVFIGGGHIYSAHTNFLQVDTPATLLK
ncbi:pyruvate kinase [Pontiella sulfatireligans]|uniref:Pyruvate kinase n=1 Tax=Pontiella sulfatireligans TaxID=2750658 RepID=A0A6C2UME2_9BACT|nr:pyruvate kinase [Pontiella sulfatireligans]VGO21169.1 Pyruvate kinase [Pontiella sulfatireligans]